LFTKKIAIVSDSAVTRLSLKKYLSKKFNVDTFKNADFNLKDYDLVIADEKFKIDGNVIKFGRDIPRPDFISEEFKKKLLELINERFGIKVKKTFSKSFVGDYKYVLVGSSTGGPGLIEKIARSLPADYPNPVCVVQHMPANFTAKFAQRLDGVSGLKVVEADNAQPVIPGFFIIAKGGWHLHFRKKDVVYCKLVPNSKNRFFVPSVDEMFFSALEIMDPKKILAVLLTGIGDDGAHGLKALKEAGAYTIAESEESAAVYGMPKAAKELGAAVKILPFDKILEEILKFK
jgi:two-component system chemotaxis response regulator CheB